MKPLILLLFALASCASASSIGNAAGGTNAGETTFDGQNEYRMSLTNSADISVFINIPARVEVRSYGGDELRIESLRRPPTRPEAAEGLRSLFSEAADNTNLGLAVTWEEKQVRITSARRHTGEYILHVPDKVRLVYQEVSPGYGGIKVSNHRGVLELSSRVGNLDLQEVTGPALLHSNAGNINIVFSELSQVGETRIQANVGNIDLSLPADTPADWYLGATIGDIFTDMDMQMADTNGTGRTRGNAMIRGETNGGGVIMNVRSGAGNIFIRER